MPGDDMDRGSRGTLIEAFITGAKHHPDARLVVASETRPAEARLAEIVAQGRHIGEELRCLGIEPGDVVAAQLPAWQEWLLVAVAAAQAGAVLLPIISIYGPKELRFVLTKSRAKVLITPDRWRRADYAEIVDRCGDLPDLAHHVVIGEAWSGALPWSQLLTARPAGPPVPRAADDRAMLIYTSGTTAEPKGVQHSNRTLLAELAAMAEARRALAGREVALSPWPPGHVAGVIQLMRFLVDGVPLVAMDQWDPATAAALVARHRVTSTSGTPFHLGGMLDAAERDGRDLSSLSHYAVGAAPVPSTLIARCSALGLATFRSYGSTEHPTVTTGDPGDRLEKRLTTEGRPMRGVEIRVVDEDGSDMGSGLDGEIATRGPDLFLGYSDPALNDATFLPGGWYRTGDIGRLDEDGFLLITDRKKDIIIRGGENIASREVEDLLHGHPAVAEVAVVAAPDERMGEIVRAYVALRPGASLALKDVSAYFAAAGVARQKTPEQLVLVEMLPRNATGKVLKHELRERARSQARR